MPFYVDDWLSSDSVDGLTVEQEGAYLRLLIRQWKAKDGTLTKDETKLARWTRLGSRWRKVGRPILDQCFIERNGGWINLKLRKLWEHTREKSRAARAAAEKRWSED